MAGSEKKDAREVFKELEEMAGSKNKDAREVAKELEEIAGSKNKDAREVSKELDEVGGNEIKDEREINKGPNPFRSDDIEFIEYGERIGKGADGAAFPCINKFDLGKYVVKKIPFNCNSEGRVKREVQALAALQHRHVMQYFQAWVEDCVAVELHSSEEDDEEIDSSEEDDEEIDPPTETNVAVELHSSEEDDEEIDSSEEDDEEIDPPSETNVSVELHSSEEDDEEIDPPTKTCFIILETCPRSLQGEMENELTREKAYEYFHQILTGVEHIHSKGWIHRDLARDNIFIDSFGNIKIGDFSLAVKSSKDKIDPDEVGTIGKKYYGASDISSDKVTTAADIYTLGVLLFEMLYPMQTESERHTALEDLTEKKIFPKDWEGDEKITGLIREMLDADPSQRPSASGIIENLFTRNSEGVASTKKN